MFDLWCPVIGSAVLRWSSDVVSVANPRRGEIDVLIRCACDDLVLLRTGRRRAGMEETVHGVDADAALHARAGRVTQAHG
ncbi:MAG TPA: hypothetical protein VFZ70_11180 [Euzebyales bacterium]